MRITRLAAPALAVVLALGASGCASIQFNPGCNFGLGNDPMADRAGQLNRSASLRGHIRAQHQAYQRKALMAGSGSQQGYRKPGALPVAERTPTDICFR